MSAGRFVTTRREAGVATVTWSRPDRRNAIGREVCAELTPALEAMAKSDCAVVILRSAGAPFCAGWDVGDFEGGAVSTPEAASEFFKPGRSLLAALANLPQVTMAVVEGKALGFGVSLLARCDLVVAAASAEIGLPEIRRGMPPATVLPEILSVMTPRAALACSITGRNVPAAEARADGLVTHVVDGGTLESFAAELAAQMAGYGTALRETKQLVRRLAATPEGDRVKVGVQSAIDRMLGHA